MTTWALVGIGLALAGLGVNFLLWRDPLVEAWRKDDESWFVVTAACATYTGLVLCGIPLLIVGAEMIK